LKKEKFDEWKYALKKKEKRGENTKNTRRKWIGSEIRISWHPWLERVNVLLKWGKREDNEMRISEKEKTDKSERKKLKVKKGKI
jgi:hypothetical protein